MNRQQKSDGIPALSTTVLFVISFVFIIFVWPSYGVRGPEDVRDPAVILPAVARAPILLLWLALNIPIAAALYFVVLTWKDRLRGDSTGLARFAFFVGLASALFFFMLGVLRITGYPYLANQYAAHLANAVTAYVGYLMVDNAFDRVAIFSSGLWLALASWTALKVNELQRLLSYLGIVSGVAGMIGAILPALAPIVLLLYMVWFLWLGISDMRNFASVSVSYTSPVSRSNRPN